MNAAAAKSLTILLLAWLLLPAGEARARAALVPVHSTALERQRTAGEEFLRAPGAEPDVRISLELIVDERGEVASVAIDPDVRDLSRRERGDRFLSLARRQLRGWRFRPWLRDGRPVPVRTAYQLQVIPPERLPQRRVAFPRAAAADTEITLDRSQCFGACPSYRVTVRGDGLVRYEGRADVLVAGTREYRIPAAEAEALIERFRAAGFWSLERRYAADITDSQSVDLVVRAGQRSKRVMDYVGEQVGMPRAVTRLQEAVDAAADTARFVSGNERTIAALEADGFDFRSPEAASMFLLSIRSAPESVPLALLDRGAPVSLPCQHRPTPFPWLSGSCVGTTYERAALASAAAAGRVALFDRLNRDDGFAAVDQPTRDRLLVSAARAHSLPIIERLLARGARAGTSDPASAPALVAALSNFEVRPPSSLESVQAAVRLLLANGADVNARGPGGTTALGFAVYEHPTIARMLIAAGADVNAHGRYSEPPLYETEDEEIALLLLAAGADRTLRDEKGRRLAERARRYGWTRVEALLAGGAR